MYNNNPITQLPPITVVNFLDVLPITDVTDLSQSPVGTSKKISMKQIQDFVINAIPWIIVTSNPTNLIPNQGYLMDTPVLGLINLPVTAQVGDQFYIEGLGPNGFQINQNAGQQIIFGNNQTTLGPGGYLASSNRGDGLTFMCIATDTTFKVRSVIGNLTIA